MPRSLFRLAAIPLGIASISILGACSASTDNAAEANNDQHIATVAADETTANAPAGFPWIVDEFADIRVLRYKLDAWAQLSLKQKQYAYYLVQAGLAGRDIMWDQNNRYNLRVRRLLEDIYTGYNGDRGNEQWQAFETYLKRIWFSNGLHHHYSNAKIPAGFSKAYLLKLAESASPELAATLNDELLAVIFDPNVEAKKVSLDADAGLLESSATNFYAPDISTAEATAYYASVIDKKSNKPISYGLNSRLEKNADGQIVENKWKIGGLYSPALLEVTSWLEKAAAVAENPAQAEALETLIAYYNTGDLALWDTYNIQWVGATDGDIDYINGFVEVYNDPLGYRGSYENIVQIKDFEASQRMQLVRNNAQWFEDNSPLQDNHKRKKVVGISYNVVAVVGESGDASPSSPIGVNLPNANWIRASVGSKSVSLGNLQQAYKESSGPVFTAEFAHDDKEKELSALHGGLASKLSTALHEVVGHASGQIEPGVGTPKETLRNFSSTLEEGRADLIALYYSIDPKLVELGVTPSTDVGVAHYDSYIRNGMLIQLRRIEPGQDIEEAHMRNRAWISRWAFEKGQKDNVIAKVERNGKTFYDIQDYQKLRALFGDLLKEVQRIKSQGDYDAAKALVESYGINVDPAIHKQVLARSEALNVPPYSGFVNPLYDVITNNNGDITDISYHYPDSFVEQMLNYSARFSHLN